MNLDIQTTVRIIFILLLIAGAGISISAVRAFREASRLRFFLKKRKILSRAWQLVLYAAIVVAGAFLFNRFAEPVTYQVFEPSPTVTLTPTITQTSTITQTATVTITPTVTIIPEFTAVPEIPIVISDGFSSEVTPNPDARFSTIVFARRLNGDYQPINPSDRFDQPNETIFGSFSYENMIPGTQWSTLWFRDGELVSYESIEWNGASGGYGYADLILPAEEWLAGFYEVQIYVGKTWKANGIFEVFGIAPTSTLTPTSTVTLLPTETPEPTGTLQPTATQTDTPVPVYTATATSTVVPTNTATLTLTPTITLTPQATRRSTIFR